jgi:hypothetical protein
MVWTPKATAPTSFSLAEAFLALIAGDTTWDWLAPWIPLVPPAQYDTAAFCSAGPYPASSLTAVDFLQAVGSNPWGGLFVGSSIIGQNVSAAAMDRVFGAYCQTTGAISWGPETCFTAVAADRGVSSVDYMAVPAGSNFARARLSAWTGPGSDDRHLQVHSGGLTDSPLLLDVTSAHVVAGGDPIALRSDAVNVNAYPYGPADYSATFCVQFGTTGSVVTHTPTPQPMPPGVIQPPVGSYPDLDALGRALDALKLQQDFILSILTSLANQTPVPIGPPGPPAAIDTTSPIDVSEAAGIIITITVLPPSVDVVFGAPSTYQRLGTVIFSGGGAYAAPLPIRVSPQLVMPFPAGTTSVVLQLALGAVGTFALIPKAIPI